jgi:hypothetical protein
MVGATGCPVHAARRKTNFHRNRERGGAAAITHLGELRYGRNRRAGFILPAGCATVTRRAVAAPWREHG